jgi:hypothetical protein
MIEKRWRLVGPYTFTSVGTALGVAQIQDACDFRVKMRVRLSNGINRVELEVKRVNSETELELGPPGNIQLRSDLTSFGVGSIIIALEQPRNDIPLQEIERAVFEEEPVVALRNMLVSPCTGVPIGTSTDDGGNVSINVSVVNPSSPYTKIVLNRGPCDEGQLSSIEYYRDATLLKTVTLSYNCDDEITEVNIT